LDGGPFLLELSGERVPGSTAETPGKKPSADEEFHFGQSGAGRGELWFGICIHAGKLAPLLATSK
jgi:hypothetical protein